VKVQVEKQGLTKHQTFIQTLPGNISRGGWKRKSGDSFERKKKKDWG